MSENNGQEPAVVSLTIPCRAEYVGVARLAILGVASRLNFSYDEVEDLRLAVGEACTGAIDRATQAQQTDASIRIDCDIRPAELTVAVNYRIPEPEDGDGGAARVEPIVDPENIGALLMEILVDNVEVENDPRTGTTVRLTKKVQLS